MNARWIAWLFALGCAGAPDPAPSATEIDVAGLLIAPMPPGATSCVATAPYLVSDLRRAVLGEVSQADALGWARSPHVAAYARCRYEGERTGAVWRVLIDGEVPLEALPMHVRRAGEPCEADACDWPVAELDGAVIEVRSPGLSAGGPEAAEAELLDLWERTPHTLEISVSGEDTRVLALHPSGVRVSRATEGGPRYEVLSWDQVEVAADDRRLRRDRAVHGGIEWRVVPLESIDFLDETAVARQLELRLDRLRRRSGRAAAAEDELASLALAALERRSEDLSVVDLAVEALRRLGRTSEALDRLDRLAIEHDHDPEAVRRVRARAWALALRAGDVSAGERLAQAGLASAGDGAEALRMALVGAVSRTPVASPGAPPLDPLDVEEEVRTWRAMVGSGAVTPLRAPVALAPLGIVPALLCLIAEDPFGEHTEVELAASFDVTSVVEGTVLISPALRLAVLPSLGVHARGATSLADAIHAMAEPFASPGVGPFVIVVRVGPSGAPTTEIRIEGTVRSGRVRVERVSPMAADWDWARLAEGLVTPFAEVVEHRFPDAEIRWASADGRALSTLVSDLDAMGYAACETDGEEAICRPRAGLGLSAVLAGARSLGALPAP